MNLLRYSYLFIIALVLVSCSKEEEQQAEVIRPVKYEVVGTVDNTKLRTFSGIVEAASSVDLSFRSGGILTEAPVAVGQRVNKGDLIGRLDNIEADAAYEQSVSSLASAESNLRTSKDQLERIKGLYESRSVALSEYESAKNNYETALAQYESAERNITIAETQVSYGFIYAPEAGIVADKDGGINEVLQAGKVFVVLNIGDKMKVEVNIPERVINSIGNGMPAEVSFNITEETFSGVVVEIAQLADPQSATYKVDVLIESTNGTVKPGMAAKVSLALGEFVGADEELFVPMKAVGEDGNGNFVFVIETQDDKTGNVRKQKITLGEMTANGFKVKSGLKKGDKIATAGLQTLLDGQKVRF